VVSGGQGRLAGILDGKTVMEFFANPATLLGVITGVGISAWALGRWQGAPLGHGSQCPHPALTQPVLCDADAVPAASPCQEQAREERLIALQDPVSLCALHDEVSAFRRTENVFATLEPDDLLRASQRAGNDRDCRYIGLIGQPTCPAMAPAQAANGCPSNCRSRTCSNALPVRPATPLAGAGHQLSLAGPALTRV
jgi:hypothetical protein